MSRQQVVLCYSMSLANLALGVALLFNIQPRLFGVATDYLPGYILAVPFFLVGCLAPMGLGNLYWIRWALFAGEMLAYLWSLSFVVQWITTGNPQPAVFFLLHVGIIKHVLAELAPRIPLFNKILEKAADNARPAACN